VGATQIMLWIAGGVQVTIAAANLGLPRRLNYRENLARVTPIVRQVFIVHSLYIVAVLLLFAGITFSFSGQLSSGAGLGRLLAGAIAIFWLCRLPVQLFYYDKDQRRKHRAADVAMTIAILFLTVTYGAAAAGIGR
jgi:hypothetical protein